MNNFHHIEIFLVIISPYNPKHAASAIIGVE
jgi:hypothetical protein